MPNQTLEIPPSTYAKKPGMEPLPGYVLIEPLGKGGFGEVWKCEAPGGLLKAVKFVHGSVNGASSDNVKLRQELEAFQQVKAIRHPFLLCLERVELVERELVIVMGLADSHLGERLEECQRSGLQGIPREELLGYLLEAAEALDVINEKYGLQHLDVKPENLLLTAGHVQVGDYGLVSKLQVGAFAGRSRASTPRYAAPEIPQGHVHAQSDQYSLALVFHELLTGSFPFSGRSREQINLEHAAAAPDLSCLPERDRGPVGTALSKQPGDRFPSCRAFIQALVNANNSHRSGLVTANQIMSRLKGGLGGGLGSTPPPQASPAPVEIKPVALRVPRPAGVERATVSAATGNTPPPMPSPVKAETPASSTEKMGAGVQLKDVGVQLKEVFSVLPVEWLHGRDASEPDLSADEMVRAVVAAAGKGKPVETDANGMVRFADGSWKCGFLTTIDPRVAMLKLDLLLEQYHLEKEQVEERCAIFFREAVVEAPNGGFGLFGKKAQVRTSGGFEVQVDVPEKTTSVGEVTVKGRIFGSPPPEFIESAEEELLAILEEVRRQLNNFEDRRKHVRIPANFPVTIFPIHSDYRLERPIKGCCENVSAGGLALRADAPITTHHAFVSFEGVRGTTGLALLLQVVRMVRKEDCALVTGRFLLNL